MPGTTWPADFEKVLRAHLPMLPDDREILPDASLTALGLDSMSTVALLVDVEDLFDVSLPDEDITEEAFTSAGTLWTLIQRQIDAG
ncbi:phosphopantetheine-binding protein [Streptomyces sp. DSM 44915]|uniref:Phosphopantetheine-binding protein n=1 Tax=Streptomyces chisholmiae TaxID=3075540 RepID=A0ABU2JMA2_9ACTN|nr:phosphopantetheine-binding protein [Streptomyces sp. DSM 44915]MDT0266099.1 phosphopantetheine-binding protein [Streptomyces sp. DSM 44915]